MLKLVKTSSRKAGLSPGSPVFIGEKVTENFGLDMVDYDAENLTISTPIRLDEFHPKSPGITATRPAFSMIP